jgi:hypothetical protein
MFNAYGKLLTGLMRLELDPLSERMESRNPGLVPAPQKTDPSEWQEDDPVWKASRILDQLERFEESKGGGTTTAGTNRSFGQIPSVPWLDKIAKEHCEKTLSEAREKAEVGYAPEFCSGFGNLGVSHSHCFLA